MRCLLALVLTLLLLPTLPVHAATQGVTIVLVRDSGLPQNELSDLEMTRAAAALEDWANHAVARAWPLPQVVIVADSNLPASRFVWRVSVREFSTVYMAYGWHGVDSHGYPMAEVSVMEGSTSGVSWVSIAAHELAEMLVDPWASLAAIDPVVSTAQNAWAVEVCDPVAPYQYAYFYAGAYWPMADFVYPSFFERGARYPFDKLHLVRAPFTPADGGYQFYAIAGPSQQVWERV